MNALIVGGAGFLGTNLARFLLEKGHVVTVVDSLEPRLFATFDNLADIKDRLTLQQGDMRDGELMRKHVARQDVVFNCAGQTSHPISMKDPVFDAELNCIGHLSLLEAVRDANPGAVVVYTSSSTVVGKAVRTPIDETHPENPLDIYSANKLVGEKYHQIFHRFHGLKTVVLRFANLFGAFGKGRSEFGFVNYFIHLGATGAEIKLFGEGHQKRNLLYARDACEVMVRAAETPALQGEVSFVAHPSHLSVRDIAATIVDAFGRGHVTHVEWPEERKRIEVDDVHISCDKLLAALPGWQPHYTFRSALEEIKQLQAAT